MADQFDMIAQQTLASAQPQAPVAGDEFDQIAQRTTQQQAADPFTQIAQKTQQQERRGLQPGQMTAREFAEYQKQPRPGFFSSAWQGMKQIPGMLKEDFTRAGQEFTDPTKSYSPVKTALAGTAGAAFDLGMLVNMVVDPITRAAAKVGLSPEEQVEVDRWFVNKAIAEGRLREDMRTGQTSLLDVSKTAEEAGVAPGMAEIGTYVLDPSVLAGGGAKLATVPSRGMSKTAAATAPRLLATPTLEAAGQAAGRVLPSQLAGRATRAVERGAGRALETTGRLARELAETKTGRAIQFAAPIVGYGLGGGGFSGGIGAVLGSLSKYVVVGKRGGNVLENAGRALTEWGQTEAGKSTLTRLQQLQISETAPRVVRNLAGKLAAGDAVFKQVGDLRRAAGAGADVMAPAVAANLAQGDRDVAGQLMGTGWALGSMGHIVTAPFTQKAGRRLMEDVDIGAWYSGLDATSQRSIDRMAERAGPAHRDAMYKAMMIEGFLNTLRPGDQPAVQIQWLDDMSWPSATGRKAGEAGHVEIDQDTGRPIVRFNADRVGETTLGHEVFHAMAKDPRIVDIGELNSVLFSQFDAEGKQISQGLFNKSETDSLAGAYLSKFDVNSDAFRQLSQERLSNPRAFEGRVAEEVAAELFGSWISKQDGKMLSSLSKPTRRWLDAAIMSHGRNWFSKGVSRVVDALGLREGSEGVESHVFGDRLRMIPQVDVMFRQMMRNRMNMGGRASEAGTETPRVMGETREESGVTATYDAREIASGAADPRLAQIFKDNDIWVRNPDGTVKYTDKGRPIMRSPGEIRRLQARRKTELFKALMSVEEAGGLRNTGSDTEPRFEGARMNDAQLEAVSKLDPTIMPPTLLDKLRRINQAIADGQALDMNYNPAVMRNRYSTKLGMTYRVGVPLRMDVTKAGNLLVITYDKVNLMEKMNRWWDYDQKLKDKGKPAKYLSEWDDFGQLNNDLETYVENLGEGRPGETGLTIEKRDRLNDLLNFRRMDAEERNPLRLSSRRDMRDTVIRSRRFDRINEVTPVPGAQEKIQYERVVQNLQPRAEDLAVSAAKEAPEPSQARGLAEDTGVSPKPPGEAPGLPKQEISSKATSLEQVPARKFYEGVEFADGGRNADIGAGKSGLFTEYLAGRGVENLRYDRFWQTPEEIATFVKSAESPTDTATVNNVLNVIKEPAPRDHVIRQAAAVIKPDGTAYFKVHEGDGSGKGKETKAGYQNNRKTADYVKEIEQHFVSVKRKGNVLIATKPKEKVVIGKDIQFQPRAEPETITHAALRIPVEDGYNVYTGPAHFVAMAKAARDLKLKSDDFMDMMGDIDGFVTDQGRFVSRQDAYRIHFGEEPGEKILDSGDVPKLREDAKTETVRDVLVGDIPSNPYIRQQVTQKKLAAKQPDTFLPDGGANSIVAGRMRYSPATFGPWAKKLRASDDAKRVFGKDGVEQIIKAAEATYKIFGNRTELLGRENVGVSPLRENADPLFVTTWDMSTVCPQQDLYLASVYHVEQSYGRILEPHERYAVGLMLQDMGMDTACWYCYGQIKRDIRDMQIGRAATIVNQLAAMDKKPSLEALQKLFGSWSVEVKNFDKSKPVGPRNAIKGLPGRKFSSLAAFLMNNFKQLKHMDPQHVRDVIREKAEASPEEADAIKVITDYTMSAVKENKPKGWAPYTDQILNMKQEDVDLFNSMAGMRMNSQTDFRPWHVLDLMQGMTHAKMRDLGMHVYTKSPDFVKTFGETGIKFNMSIEYAHDASGNPVPRAAEGGGEGYKFNDMEGMPDAEALALRDRFKDNVGTMLVAFNPDEVVKAMADPYVDMIIPYHKGGVPKSIEAQINAVDMSKDQHEHPVKGKWDAWGKPGKVYAGRGKQVKTRMKTVTLDDGSKVTVYHNRPITRAEHQNSKERYLEICEKAGLVPKFSEWTGHKGYMKLIRDVSRNPGKQGAVDPSKIDWDAANDVVTNWQDEGGDKIKLPDNMKRAFDKAIKGGLIDEKVAKIKENLEVRLKQEKEAKKAAARAKKAGREG